MLLSKRPEMFFTDQWPPIFKAKGDKCGTWMVKELLICQ
jgi:hypothetical protein